MKLSRFGENLIIKLLGAILFALLFGQVQYVMYVVTPSSNWFVTHSIEPIKYRYQIGESLVFVSNTTYKRQVDIRWNDILRCDFGDGRGFYAYSSRDKHVSNHSNQQKRQIWTYTGSTPLRSGICYIESITTVELPYGIKKSQEVQSHLFNIGEVRTNG